jgi:hypothetical protein
MFGAWSYYKPRTYEPGVIFFSLFDPDDKCLDVNAPKKI